MKDDLNLGNIGNAPKEYDNTFFWRAFRDLEMFISKLLSKGPITVSNLKTDSIEIDGVPFLPDDYVKDTGDTMTGVLNINSTAAGSLLNLTSVNDTNTSGPSISLIRASPSPAANDPIGVIYFQGRDSANVTTTYAHIYATILDPADGVEMARLNFHTVYNGASAGGGFTLSSAGLVPVGNGVLNLGSASARWNTVYTSDLSLKNEHGDWTIVEGADDLFITNNRTGKKYKFLLTEAD